MVVIYVLWIVFIVGVGARNSLLIIRNSVVICVLIVLSLWEFSLVVDQVVLVARDLMCI